MGLTRRCVVNRKADSLGVKGRWFGSVAPAILKMTGELTGWLVLRSAAPPYQACENGEQSGLVKSVGRMAETLSWCYETFGEYSSAGLATIDRIGEVRGPAWENHVAAGEPEELDLGSRLSLIRIDRKAARRASAMETNQTQSYRANSS